MGLWSCSDPVTKPFKCKTDKDGAFSAPADSIDAPLPIGTVDLSGKLVSPKGITVQGTLSFNSAKKNFSGKAGTDVSLGKFKVERKNTIKLDGTTDPPTPNASLEFQVSYIHCP